MIKKIIVVFLFSAALAAAQSPIPPGAKLVRVATGLIQPEGPLWKNGVLLFSDIQGNLIYQWSPTDSTLEPYLDPSQNSNGLTLDRQGRLILTQMGLRRVSRQETDGTITPLTSTFRGKKYNSPNDVVVKSDGAIFFTDPDYNVPAGQSVELSFKGIYRISPSGTVTLIDSTFDKPNGICFSPDEKRLYVNNTTTGSIYVWDVENDSVLINKRLFYAMPGNAGGVDGMKVDSAGNIYCTGPGGLWIISPNGVYLDKIPISTGPSNCAWGDADGKTLYITGGYGDGTLYKIRLASTTKVDDRGCNQQSGYQLYANYPNPFNPRTEIRYTIPEVAHVLLTIYDIDGQKVKTLIDAVQNPGTYNLFWNASSSGGKQLSSGTYLACLNAGRISKSIKLLLLK